MVKYEALSFREADMAKYRCVRCGNVMDIDQNAEIGKCDHCNAEQALPICKDENMLSQYNTANELFHSNEYDAAEDIYELLAKANPNDPIAHWMLLLCKYGVQYCMNDDSKEWKPTIKGFQDTRIQDDPSYSEIMHLANEEQQNLFKREAEELEILHRDFIWASKKEQFIELCISYHKKIDDFGEIKANQNLFQHIESILSEQDNHMLYRNINLDNIDTINTCIKSILLIGSILSEQDNHMFYRNIKPDNIFINNSCVFVSYSHKDIKWANEVVRDLEYLGFNVWKDDKYDVMKESLESASGIPAGSEWPSEIETAIIICEGFIGLVSENSVKSKWCVKELVLAEQQTDHANILIRQNEDVQLPSGIQYTYADKHTIVWSETDSRRVWASIKSNTEFWSLRDGGIEINDLPSMAEKINDHLKTDKENHQSFQLMTKLNERLIPRGGSSTKLEEMIPNNDRMVSGNGGEQKTFGNFIKDSWEIQTHLFIEGTGGIGKSVALLSFATEPSFPKDIASIYIPLYRLADEADSGNKCIDAFLQRKFAKDEFDWIEKISKSERHERPNIILLLDGYNEIPIDNRKSIIKSIRDWSERKGVQIITTSRFSSEFNNASFKKIQLLELDKSTVENYLQDHNITIPTPASLLWEVISTPLMLKIYANVNDVENQANNEYLPFKHSDNAGSLIWNYMLKEVNRCLENTGNFDSLEYVAAIMLVTPYIAWKMEKQRKFDLSSNEFEDCVDEACNYWKDRKKPTYFIRIERHLRKRWNGDVIALADNQRSILEDEVSMFWKIKTNNRYCYVLLHQNFRDGFAAVHLYHIALTYNSTFPEEYKYSLSDYVVGYLTDITKDDPSEDEPFERLWETNRICQPTKIEATHNLLRIIHKNKNGDLSSLNWSGMDISKVNLFNYRQSNVLSISHSKLDFDKTIIDVSCFKPNAHTDKVRCVVFSQDGKKLISSSDDMTIRIWDVETKQQIGDALKGHTGCVRSVACSPDNLWIASGSDDMTVRIWDIETHQQIGTPLVGHNGRINCVAISPDGSRLLSCSDDKTIILWDPENHEQVLPPLRGHKNWVSSAVFSMDGKRIISCSWDKTIRIWNVEDGKQIGKGIRIHHSPAISVAINQDDKRIAVALRNNKVYLWNIETQKQIGKPLEGHNNWINCVAFNSTGNKIVSGSSDSAIRIWDTDTCEQIGKPLFGSTGAVYSIAFSPDKKTIASGSADNSIRFWNERNHQQIGNAIENSGQLNTSDEYGQFKEEPIEILSDIDISGLNLSLSIVDPKSKRILSQNGVKFDEEQSAKKQCK